MICGFIKGQELTLTTPIIADGTIDYLTAQFIFSSKDWQGLKIYAHFTQGQMHFFTELENGKITQDKHLNLTEGEWEVYLHGNAEENGQVKMRITTEPKTIKVVKSGVEGGSVFPEMSGDAGEQILAKANYALEIAEVLRKDLEEGKYANELTEEDITKISLEIADKIFTNKKTLDNLYCPAVENLFTQMIDDHYLKFNGSALRYVSDGAVIGRVEEVKKEGQSFLRLHLYDGRGLILGNSFPDYIDIPVAAVKDVTENSGDIILNGSELDLGIPSGGTSGGNSVTVDDEGYIVID